MQSPWGDASEPGEEEASMAGSMRSRASGAAQVTLDPVFTDNARLSEAAALVEKMLPLAREVRTFTLFSFSLLLFFLTRLPERNLYYWYKARSWLIQYVRTVQLLCSSLLLGTGSCNSVGVGHIELPLGRVVCTLILDSLILRS